MEGSAGNGTLDEAKAWALLEALSRRVRTGDELVRATGLTLDAEGGLIETELGSGLVSVYPGAPTTFEATSRVEPSAAQMLNLYLPLCLGGGSPDLVVGHVGQSLDGQIATASGASRYVTGPENIRHMHRLRALFDAVIVGANTVEKDDPQLTTRLVPGKNPTRVILDPSLRLAGTQQVFRDGAAPTLVLCCRGRSGNGHYGNAEIIPVESDGELLDPQAIARTLRARGLRRLFVEGGGITISRFLTARVFHRLHVTICSVFLGAGRPGISLPGIDRMEGALRPRSRRFSMGDDVLFDCSFEPSAQEALGAGGSGLP
jgi:riboflavin-specific deaminase-like protein